MTARVAINGFGRIGRLVARHLKTRKGFDLVAINDLTSPDMLGYLFAPDFFRVVGWYDNENAYALRCVDLFEYMVGRDRT
jgi:glyceraldehyde-3-phosphate dehydrogenase/erythrose-4-phosphate dehydrogenase